VNVVSNAGPLIALGKLGQLSMLLTLYGDILIPRQVYNEVVINGLRLGADDAPAVDSLVQQGYIRCWTHRCAGRKNPATRLRSVRFFAVRASLCHNTACWLQPMITHQECVSVLLCSGCLLCCCDGYLARLRIDECLA
jgi:hypothetical protein